MNDILKKKFKNRGIWAVAGAAMIIAVICLYPRKARRVRTLLVDDSQCMREYLGHLVRAEGGFDVVGTATDGLQALRLVSVLRPDLILMDVRMPCMDGLEATRILKQNPAQSTYLPVIIVVTSEDTATCRCEAKEAGADGFVAKSATLRLQLKYTLHRLFSADCEPLAGQRG
jgi:CheY-like chemotaxis protein